MLAFERHRANHPEDVPLLLVVSDGRANVAGREWRPAVEMLTLAGEIRARGIESVVVDTESGSMRVGLCRPLSEALGAVYLPLGQLRRRAGARGQHRPRPRWMPRNALGAAPSLRSGQAGALRRRRLLLGRL